MRRAWICILIMMVTSFMGLIAENEEGLAENDKDLYYVRISMQGDHFYDNANILVYSHTWSDSPASPDSIKMWLNGEKVDLKRKQSNYWTAKHDLEYSNDYIIDLCFDSLMIKDTKIRMVDRHTVFFQHMFFPDENYVFFWDLDNDSDLQELMITWDYEQGKWPQHDTRFYSLNPGDRSYIVPPEILRFRDTTTYCDICLWQKNQKRRDRILFEMIDEAIIQYEVSEVEEN